MKSRLQLDTLVDKIQKKQERFPEIIPAGKSLSNYAPDHHNQDHTLQQTYWGYQSPHNPVLRDIQ